MNKRLMGLIAIAVETEEKAVKVKQVPGGVWRKYCPVCRKEYLPHEPTCSNCVETNAAIINAFRKKVKKVHEEEPDKTREEIEDEILKEKRQKSRSAKAHGRHGEARKLDAEHKVLEAYMDLMFTDRYIKRLQEGVEDKDERERIRKKIYDAPEVKKQMKIVKSILPEAIEVAPSRARLLSDLVHRLRGKGMEVTTTYVAAKGLRFADKDTFINTALEKGIRPIESLDPTGSVQMSEQISRKLQQEGIRPQPELYGYKSPFHYAVWRVSDIARLKRLMKNEAERADLQIKLKELEGALKQLYQKRYDIRKSLKELEDMAAKAPERMTETYIRRQSLQNELQAVEEQLKERHTEMKNMEAELKEKPAIKF